MSNTTRISGTTSRFSTGRPQAQGSTTRTSDPQNLFHSIDNSQRRELRAVGTLLATAMRIDLANEGRLPMGLPAIGHMVASGSGSVNQDDSLVSSGEPPIPTPANAPPAPPYEYPLPSYESLGINPQNNNSSASPSQPSDSTALFGEPPAYEAVVSSVSSSSTVSSSSNTPAPVLSWKCYGSGGDILIVVVRGNARQNGEFHNVSLEAHNIVDDRGQCDLEVLNKIGNNETPPFPMAEFQRYFPGSNELHWL